MDTQMITSILDNDYYTFTVGQAVMEHYYGVDVEYKFKDRGNTKYSQEFLELLTSEVEKLNEIKLTDQELDFLKWRCPDLKPQYLEFLKNYRFDSSEVTISLNNGKLDITIKGKWHRTIFWEVVLLALVSECYYRTDGAFVNPMDCLDSSNEFLRRTVEKADKLHECNATFADFGTRRRNSVACQANVVQEFKNVRGFVGTSNVHFANIYGVKPIGTMSHQWIMGISALESLRHANRFAMEKWVETYNGSLGIMLPDTFGTEAFFKDFVGSLPKLYDGVRHDSGCPFKFGMDVIEHYQNLGIDPMSKTIVFSDGLDTDKAIKIQKYFYNKINTSAGIGTHFTNDFPNSQALRIVIKLYQVNGIPVVKLSDEPGKEMGDEKAVENAKWTFGRE